MSWWWGASAGAEEELGTLIEKLKLIPPSNNSEEEAEIAVENIRNYLNKHGLHTLKRESIDDETSEELVKSLIWALKTFRASLGIIRMVIETILKLVEVPAEVPGQQPSSKYLHLLNTNVLLNASYENGSYPVNELIEKLQITDFYVR